LNDQAEHARSMAGLVEVCFRMQLRVESGKENVAIGQAFASDVIAACEAGEKAIERLLAVERAARDLWERRADHRMGNADWKAPQECFLALRAALRAEDD
jgi:hypothetical protein